MSSGDGDNDDMDGDILLPLPPHVLDDTRAPEDAEGAEAEEGHTRSKVSGSTDAGAVNGEGTDVESACAEIEATSADNAEVSEAVMMTEINTPSEAVGTKGGVAGEEIDRGDSGRVLSHMNCLNPRYFCMRSTSSPVSRWCVRIAFHSASVTPLMAWPW